MPHEQLCPAVVESVASVESGGRGSHGSKTPPKNPAPSPTNIQIQNPLNDDSPNTGSKMNQLSVQGEGDAEEPRKLSLREIIFEAFEEPVSSPVAIVIMAFLNT